MVGRDDTIEGDANGSQKALPPNGRLEGLDVERMLDQRG